MRTLTGTKTLWWFPFYSYHFLFLLLPIPKGLPGLWQAPSILRSIGFQPLQYQNHLGSFDKSWWLAPSQVTQIMASGGAAWTSAFCQSPPGDPNVRPGLRTTAIMFAPLTSQRKENSHSLRQKQIFGACLRKPGWQKPRPEGPMRLTDGNWSWHV